MAVWIIFLILEYKLLIMKKTLTKQTRRTPVTHYEAISNNVYYDGTSYRVRAVVDGTKHSKNFPSKRKAITYRKELLGV